MGLYWKAFRFSRMSPEGRADWVHEQFDSIRRDTNPKSRERRYLELLDVRSEFIAGGGGLPPDVEETFNEIHAAYLEDAVKGK